MMEKKGIVQYETSKENREVKSFNEKMEIFPKNQGFRWKPEP